jgi:hypothetical protein
MTDASPVGVQKDDHRRRARQRPGHEELGRGQFHGAGAILRVANVGT